MQQSTSSDTPSPKKNISYNAIPLFPTPLLQIEVPEYKEILPIAYKLRDEDPDGMKASNMGGWHSPLQPLPDVIHNYVPFPDWNGTAWYMINKNMQGNYSHTHPLNDWAAVLWLKVPPNAARLEFEHPDCFAQYKCIDSVGKYHKNIREQFNYWQAWSVEPVEGRMLMFPASLRHRVYFSATDEERIAMSFNISLVLDPEEE